MSSQSAVSICNLALNVSGSRSSIASLQESSPEARTCSLHFGQALANMLQAARWNFARKQAPLSLLLDGTTTPPAAVPQPWVYEYAYPSDCIQVRFIMPLLQVGAPQSGMGSPDWVGPPVRFIVSSDTDSGGNAIKVILTNQPQALLVYTAEITDVGLWDDQFVTAFVYYMAHRISIPLSGNKTLAKMNYEIAVKTCNEAEASNGNEGLTVIDSIPDWMRVRGYASDWAFPPGGAFTLPPANLSLIG